MRDRQARPNERLSEDEASRVDIFDFVVNGVDGKSYTRHDGAGVHLRRDFMKRYAMFNLPVLQSPIDWSHAAISWKR